MGSTPIGAKYDSAFLFSFNGAPTGFSIDYDHTNEAPVEVAIPEDQESKEMKVVTHDVEGNNMNGWTDDMFSSPVSGTFHTDVPLAKAALEVYGLWEDAPKEMVVQCLMILGENFDGQLHQAAEDHHLGHHDGSHHGGPHHGGPHHNERPHHEGPHHQQEGDDQSSQQQQENQEDDNGANGDHRIGDPENGADVMEGDFDESHRPSGRAYPAAMFGAVFFFLSIFICCCCVAAGVQNHEEEEFQMQSFTPQDDDAIINMVQQQSLAEYEAQQFVQVQPPVLQAAPNAGSETQYMRVPVMTPETYAEFLAAAQTSQAHP
eukprot:CAMPEP_0201481674 /NCGR_PEP_ID=MMETSP0151_2-20130828/5939_1 /ASSEMBLY_ACC=CAM_ASM_000257 /TAXON_ID=200890 /ORGANISM="Paramoeba atlantica, Strain 621/1 / CCAP 1560/9" /LENGTH=317 /DNA_ID=CAMNT_0047863995 /DNA_START=214 /DNA_END=1167 /DNA_ORIENTATION=+